MTKLINRFVKEEDGATAIEYGLIAALIAVALIASLQSISGAISSSFTNTADQINTTTSEATD